MFDCIVNTDAPYPRFLSVQGLELIQKVITAGSRAGLDGALGTLPNPRGWGRGRRAGPWGQMPWLSICPLAQLLQKCPEKRLGAGERDAEEIKTQPFFRVSGQGLSGPGAWHSGSH